MIMDAVRKKLVPWFKAKCGYFSVEESVSASCKVLILPRQYYFETYKSYPLSIGRDIQKVAAIEARQISPYNKAAETLTQHFVIKQEDKFLVYYFVLHPKHFAALNDLTPWFIVPESLLELLRLNKLATSAAEPVADSYFQDEAGIWVSKVGKAQTQLNSSELLELLKPAWLEQTVRRLHNDKVIQQISASFERWKQVKLIVSVFVIASLYLGTVSGYQYAVDMYLNQKRSESAPIVSDIFKAKSQLDEITAKSSEYATAYGEVTNDVSALIFIESLQQKHQLQVDRFRFFGNRLVLEGLALNANGLLAEISNNNFVKRAELKGDIRKAGSGGRFEQFTIEFYWEDKLWQ